MTRQPEKRAGRSRDLAWWAGLVILLALVACGQRATVPVAETTPGAGRPAAGLGAHITPTRAPTVDVAAKNLTATAHIPTVVVITQEPTAIGTSSAVWITHGGPIIDHVSFVDKLRGKRCTVEFTTAVRQPFLRGQPIGLRVSNCGLARPTELQSFWYHTDDLHTDGLRAAEEDARAIGVTGQPSGIAIDWVAPPHFFRKERAFVLYLGDDPAMLALLTELLGPQFAGR
jgi:hypothetical protein